MQVMLSVPIPSSVFGARICSKSSSTQFDKLSSLIPGFPYRSLIFFTHSSLVTQSQIPSQARTMNWSFLVLSVFVKSGLAVTACYSGLNWFWSLYWKSPNALLRAKLPSTLESSTWWLAFYILFSSSSLSGLWSSLSGTALLSLLRHPRLSPAFEQ